MSLKSFIKNNKSMCCLLNKTAKTIQTSKVHGTDLLRPQRSKADQDIGKKRWIHKYSYRLLRLWFRWQTPLGVAQSYIEHIEEDLADYYDEPLKRIFIETTYCR